MYPIPPKAFAYLMEHAGAGGADLTREFGIPGRSARRYARKFRMGLAIPQQAFNVDSEVYTGAYVPGKPRQYTGHWKLEGDFLVLNDIHIPATNWDFAERALEVALQHLESPRKVIIAGDLINGDALSRWDDIIPVTPLADELVYAEAYLNHLALHFDEIYFSRGNHEDRLLKAVKGQIHAPHFRRMLSDNKKVHFSMYSYMDVVSGGKHWRITHQKAYSRNALTVAKKLAAKNEVNVICAHQHHSAAGRSENNRYTCVDSGGLHDATKMSYVMLDDNTSPVMSNGFVLLKDGAATLFTPYDTMTSMEMLCPANGKR